VSNCDQTPFLQRAKIREAMVYSYGLSEIHILVNFDEMLL